MPPKKPALQRAFFMRESFWVPPFFKKAAAFFAAF
jgi:hypothetical protein